MDDEDIAVVQQALEAFNRGGIEAVSELADPAIEFQGAGLVIPREVLRGIDHVVEQLRLYEANFDGLRFTALEFLRRGDAVVVPAHFTGQGRSGDKLQLVLTLAFWVREGKLARIQVYTSRETALEEIPPE